MYKLTSPYIKLILVVVFLLTLGNTYSQNKKPITNKTIFGKTVKASTANPANGKIRCATTEYEQFLQEKNPKRMTNAQFETWVTPLVNKYKAMRTNSKTVATVITIPVVVHVIYDGQPIGTAPNITDAQVESQITVLNQDYSRLLGSPGYNTNPVGANTEIQFVLAKQDPKGNPTNGIDRVSLCQPSWSDVDIDAIVKPATIWDSSLYMNMWSINFTDTSLLGYAQFPDASGLDGLDPSGGAADTDGVVSNYNVFGSITYDDGTFLLDTTYNKGRTMSHEVGHWLGLKHIWGDGTGDEAANSPDCTASDFCADTPQAGWEHYSCGTFDTCPSDPGNDMPENYMDYTEDACMNIFTQNQKDRIRTIIDYAPRRSSLKTSNKGTAISLVANDAEVKLEVSCSTPICGTPANQNTQKITIYNRGTSNLTSATINYNINGGSNKVYNWTGDLATNKPASFDITINSAVDGTINVSVGSANGGTDQRPSNNSASGSFTIPVTQNYNYTTYTFRLQKDLYASETDWNLKDASGKIIYSGGCASCTGGVYNDAAGTTLPNLVTKTWTLSNNQCYTFTINDGVGDGICCGGGDGYYDIKTNNGAITVKSGGSFTSSEITTFTTNTLGVNKFDALNDIYLYPNPTKETLNILVPSNFGLPNSYAISNTLGQIISRKAVSKEADLIVNTSSLSKGIYFIKITKEDQTKTLQFIKE
ncbi:T9SS type A sorting domain-containing protein [Flavobacterium sp.]|uniref:T9SS type A sorting domain-containing protein n=1 Tax=Flavobacterium sp. TaxID=239 RepID=UPI00286E8FD0|nr:T9SS type A sorting domain-containing protein [Flavobacterium sp.]